MNAQRRRDPPGRPAAPAATGRQDALATAPEASPDAAKPPDAAVPAAARSNPRKRRPKFVF